MRRMPLFVLALTSAVGAFGTAACSKLTEPAKVEPIQSEPAGAEAKQAANGAPSGAPTPAPSAAPAVPEGKLEVTDVTVGKGTEAKDGDQVKVHYVGTLVDGKQFDANKDGDEPFAFELGKGRVIKGWDEGVKGMKVGGKRKLKIPPSMAYGPRGVPGAIPPNSTLLFDVELLGVGNEPVAAGGGKKDGGAPPAKPKGDAGAPKRHP